MCAFTACAQPSTNVNDIYQQIGFNPLATNCGVLLQISDIHMAVLSNELAQHTIVTNLDPRLVAMVNALSPQPTAMILTGDLCTAGALAFGNRDYEPFATNEMILAKEALKQFTNFPMYMVPGNHDNPAYEVTNSALFNSVFPGTPRFTNFTIAGLPVLALAGHGGGWLDPEERAWLTSFRDRLDHSKPVLVAIHQPILNNSGEDARESEQDILWFLKPWTAPVWVMSGHAHIRDAVRYPLGMTTISAYTCPAAQNWLIPTSNPLVQSACGFYLWCITNGTVAEVIEGVLTNQTYYRVNCDTNHTPIPLLYSGNTNILFRAEEGHFNRAAYNVSLSFGFDVTYWWSYVSNYTCRFPVEKYPDTTQAYFLASSSQAVCYLGTNTNSWLSAPTRSYLNGVLTVDIPTNLRSGPLWGVISNAGSQLFVGGFGLATTNPITDFQAWAGVTVGDSSISPQTILTNAGGITAWDAYMFGLDATHVETFREQAGFPSVGTLPFTGSGLLRFGGRTNMNYQVFESALAGGPWSTTTNTISLTTNGWNEYMISNHSPAGFFRIAAPYMAPGHP